MQNEGRAAKFARLSSLRTHSRDNERSRFYRQIARSPHVKERVTRLIINCRRNNKNKKQKTRTRRVVNFRGPCVVPVMRGCRRALKLIIVNRPDPGRSYCTEDYNRVAPMNGKKIQK